MSSDRGDAADPNDPYRTPSPTGSGPGASPPEHGPSGYGVTPSGYEGRGNPEGLPPYGSSSASEPPYGTSPQPPYGSTPYGGSPYGTQRAPGTDGFAIAALVTGLLTMGIVPIILGIIALSRIKRSGQDGRGLAIAGIVLGVLGVLLWLLVIGGAIVLFTAFESGEFETYGLGIVASGVGSPG